MAIYTKIKGRRKGINDKKSVISKCIWFQEWRSIQQSKVKDIMWRNPFVGKMKKETISFMSIFHSSCFSVYFCIDYAVEYFIEELLDEIQKNKSILNRDTSSEEKLYWIIEIDSINICRKEILKKSKKYSFLLPLFDSVWMDFCKMTNYACFRTQSNM